MTRYRTSRSTTLLTLCLLYCGCSEPAPTLVKEPAPGETPAVAPAESSAAAPASETTAAELPKLADPLPPLDEGRVEVAGPEGWSLPARDSKWLARFQLQPGDPYPTIFVNQPQERPTQADVTPENAAEFARQVQARLKQELEPQGLTVPEVKPLVIGDFAGAEYERQATVKSKNLQLERLYLVTVQGGREYTIELHTLFGTLRQFRNYALAVAEGMKIHTDAAAAASDN